MGFGLRDLRQLMNIIQLLKSDANYNTTITFPNTKLESIISYNGDRDGESRVCVNFTNNTCLMLNRCIIKDNQIIDVLDSKGNSLVSRSPIIECIYDERKEYGCKGGVTDGTQRKT